MKLRLIALAALSAAGAAHALSPAAIESARTAGTLKEIFLTGASAQRLSIGAYMQDICNASNFDVFFDSATGSNRRAYSCTLKAKTGNYNAGTPIVVYKRDNGGSIYGVNPLVNGSPAAPFTSTATINMTPISTSIGCTTTANPSPATDIAKPTFICAASSLVVPDGGLSDLEPAMFTKLLNAAPINLPAGNDDVGNPWAVLNPQQLAALDVKVFNQTLFGVIVNTNAYRALQAAQGLAQDDTDANKPSLPRAFYTGAAAGFLSGSSSAKPGWQSVIPASVDANVATKQINVCRRGAGSGTQAASNLFFLKAGLIATNALGAYTPAGAQGTLAATGTFAVNEAGSTGAVITCVTNATVASSGGYTMGVVSRENNPFTNGGDAGYRFVRIDGALPNKDLAKVGGYPFVYAASMQYLKTGIDVNKKAFMLAMRTNAGTAKYLALNDVDTQQGQMASPSTFAGLCSAQTDPNIVTFGSCVERLEIGSQWTGPTTKTNSQAELKLVK